MKKSLIALAVLGAFSAPAFADTTLYGILDAALVHASNTGQASQTTVVSGGLSTSRLGVKGAEDADGMKIVYQWEIGLDSADSNGLNGVQNNGNLAGTNGASRQKLLGLAGDFGTVATGYLQTTGYDFENKYDPAAGSSVSAIQNMTTGNAQFLIGTKASATRAQRALAYISPNISGLTIAVNYTTALGGPVGLGNLGNAAGVNTNTSGTLVSAYYDAGVLSVGGVYAALSSPVAGAGGATNEKEYALGASYDAGMAKVFGTYQATHNDSATPAGNTDKIYSLSGVIPAGPGAVALTYAKAKIGTDTTGNSDGSSYTGAYLYSLSKTATVYAAYSHATNGSGTNAFSVDNSALHGGASSLGASSNLLALGLKKAF